MQKTINFLQEQLVGFHDGTISPALIETVKIPYYGQTVPLKHIATVSFNNRVSISVFDPTVVKSIEKQLQTMGFNAYIFAKNIICINVPSMSGEQKDKIIGHIKRLGEEAKVSIRNIRKDYRHKLNKEELNKQDNDIQKITNIFISEIERIVNVKTCQIRPHV